MAEQMAEQMFEGVPVVDFQAQLPSITLDCDYYEHGTILRLAVEVRVKDPGYKEDKDGNFVRYHKLTYQDVHVVSAYNPSDAQDQVSGALAGGAIDTDMDTGLDVGRTADQWPAGVGNGQATTEDGRTIDTETGEVTEAPSAPEEAVEPEPAPDVDAWMASD